MTPFKTSGLNTFHAIIPHKNYDHSFHLHRPVSCADLNTILCIFHFRLTVKPWVACSIRALYGKINQVVLMLCLVYCYRLYRRPLDGGAKHTPLAATSADSKQQFLFAIVQTPRTNTEHRARSLDALEYISDLYYQLLTKPAPLKHFSLLTTVESMTLRIPVTCSCDYAMLSTQ